MPAMPVSREKKVADTKVFGRKKYRTSRVISIWPGIRVRRRVVVHKYSRVTCRCTEREQYGGQMLSRQLETNSTLCDACNQRRSRDKYCHRLCVDVVAIGSTSASSTHSSHNSPRALHLRRYRYRYRTVYGARMSPKPPFRRALDRKITVSQ